MLICALGLALGALGVCVWAINGGRAFFFGGLAALLVFTVLLILLGRKTKKSENRTHGAARVCLTAVVVTLAFCTAALPALHLFRNVNGHPVSAAGLLDRGDTTLIAHRGFSALCPQNTLPAFSLAAQLGMDGYEFDVHTSKDGVWVVNHDDTVDNMTDGSGRISDYTYAELQDFTVDNGNNVSLLPGLKLPTLEQALDVCAGKEIFPVIEIKDCDPARFPALLQAVYDRGLREKALIISFSMEYLEGIRALDPEIRMSYLTNALTTEDVDKCAALGNTGVDINVGNALKMGKALRYAKAQGLDMVAWTVDMPVFVSLARAYGIRTVTTNRIAPANVDLSAARGLSQADS